MRYSLKVKGYSLKVKGYRLRVKGSPHPSPLILHPSPFQNYRLKVMGMNEGLFSYRDLDAYKRAKDLVSEIYGLFKSFPKEENYALCDQLRRAVISIPSNIAEGMGRASVKEQIHFIEIAYGSLYEVMCQLEVAQELGYITNTQLAKIEKSVIDIAKPLSGLRSKRISLLNNKG